MPNVWNCTNEIANAVRRMRMRINVWKMKMPGQIKMFAGCLRVKLSDIGETNGSPCLRINKETRIILLRPKRKNLRRKDMAWSVLRPSVRESWALAPVTQADPGHFSLTVLILFFPPLSHLPYLCVFPLFPISVAAAGGSCSDQNTGNIQRNQCIVLSSWRYYNILASLCCGFHFNGNPWILMWSSVYSVFSFSIIHQMWRHSSWDLNSSIIFIYNTGLLKVK